MIIYKGYKVYDFAYIIAYTQSKRYNRLYVQVFLDMHIVPASGWVRLTTPSRYESDAPLSEVNKKNIFFENFVSFIVSNPMYLSSLSAPL